MLRAVVRCPCIVKSSLTSSQILVMGERPHLHGILRIHRRQAFALFGRLLHRGPLHLLALVGHCAQQCRASWIHQACEDVEWLRSHRPKLKYFPRPQKNLELSCQLGWKAMLKSALPAYVAHSNRIALAHVAEIEDFQVMYDGRVPRPATNSQHPLRAKA
ncbi:unnamed protein product [Prorocentrum cordatum]|uniref:Uncharacterized protein n=1 Tax=Prorocentrum cordatum TaxID=2364126 RepID=A0ABN9PGD7_9DINO|nr:unnamed protein product [Polarella glacialis]